MPNLHAQFTNVTLQRVNEIVNKKEFFDYFFCTSRNNF